MEIQLEPKCLLACSFVMGDSRRPQIEGIHLQSLNGNLQYTATTGDELVQTLTPCESILETPFILPSEVVIKVLKAYKAIKNKGNVIITLKDSTLELLDYDNKQTFSFTKSDLTFPDVERVKPRGEILGAKHFGMKLKSLKLIGDAAKSYAGYAPSLDIPLEFIVRDATTVIEVKINQNGFYGLMMPVRV